MAIHYDIAKVFNETYIAYKVLWVEWAVLIQSHLHCFNNFKFKGMKVTSIQDGHKIRTQ